MLYAASICAVVVTTPHLPVYDLGLLILPVLVSQSSTQLAAQPGRELTLGIADAGNFRLPGAKLGTSDAFANCCASNDFFILGHHSFCFKPVPQQASALHIMKSRPKSRWWLRLSALLVVIALAVPIYLSAMNPSNIAQTSPDTADSTLKHEFTQLLAAK
jgi:hypothetical protein